MEAVERYWEKGCKRRSLNRKTRKAMKLSCKHGRHFGFPFSSCGSDFEVWADTIQVRGFPDFSGTKRRRKKPRPRWRRRFERWCKETREQYDSDEIGVGSQCEEVSGTGVSELGEVDHGLGLEQGV